MLLTGKGSHSLKLHSQSASMMVTRMAMRLTKKVMATIPIATDLEICGYEGNKCFEEELR